MSIQHHIYREAEPGATHFIFIPSIFGSAETIRVMAETVAAPYGLSYLDIRSHIRGLTEFSWQSLLEETEILLAEMDLSHVVLVGFSMGGFLIQSVLERRNYSCQGFVLWSSGHGLPPTLMWRAARRAHPLLSLEWMRRVFHKTGQFVLQFKAADLSTDLEALSPELTMQVIEQLRDLNYAHFLLGTEIPFLANRDRFDFVIPPVAQEICYRRGRAIDIPFSGHGFVVSGQVRFAQEIVNRFGEHRPVMTPSAA